MLSILLTRIAPWTPLTPQGSWLPRHTFGYLCVTPLLPTARESPPQENPVPRLLEELKARNTCCRSPCVKDQLSEVSPRPAHRCQSLHTCCTADPHPAPPFLAWLLYPRPRHCPLALHSMQFIGPAPRHTCATQTCWKFMSIFILMTMTPTGPLVCGKGNKKLCGPDY